MVLICAKAPLLKQKKRLEHSRAAAAAAEKRGKKGLDWLLGQIIKDGLLVWIGRNLTNSAGRPLMARNVTSMDVIIPSKDLS